jgi:1-deoxy-D-xylulose-5-phosphate reductoisomerase
MQQVVVVCIKRIWTAVLNAANEAAVKLFLNDKIEFLEIERIIEKEIKDDKYMEIPYTLENVVSVSLSLMKEILSRYGVD